MIPLLAPPPELPRLVVSLGHADPIRRLAFAADGRRLMTQSYVDGARLWDLDTGMEIEARRGERGASLSPDGQSLVTPETDRRLRGASAVALSPDGRGAARLERDGRVTWATDGSFRPLPGPPVVSLKDNAVPLAFEAGGARLALRGEDGLVWDTASGALLWRGGWDLAVSPDGRWIAGIGASPGSLRLLDTRTGFQRTVRTGDDWHGDPRFGGGALFFLSARSPQVTLWRIELATGATRRLRTDRELSALAVAPDGRRAAVEASDGGVLVVDAGTGRTLHRLSLRAGSDAKALAFSPDGARLAVAMGTQVSLFAADSGREVEQLRRRAARVSAIAEDGGALVLAAGARAVRWRLDSGQAAPAPGALSGVAPGRWYDRTRTHRFDADLLQRSGAQVLQLSADGHRFAGRVLAPAAWVVGETATGRVLRRFPGARWLALSPRGDRALVDDPDGLRLAATAGGGPGARVSAGGAAEPVEAAFSADGRRVAWCVPGRELAVADTAGGRVVRRWSAPAFQTRFPYPVHVALAPDGDSLAVLPWDAAPFVVTARGERRALPVSACTGAAFSPDGRLLALADLFGSVTVIRAGDATVVWRVDAHPRSSAGDDLWIDALRFRGDSRSLITAGRDGTVALWRLPSRLLTAPQENVMLPLHPAPALCASQDEPARNEPLLIVRFDNVGVDSALRQLFTAARRSWRLEGVTAGDLAGIVTVTQRRLRLAEALALVLKSARSELAVTVVRGEYVITRVPSTSAARPLAATDPLPKTRSLPAGPNPTLLVQKGLAGRINQVAFSADGARLLANAVNAGGAALFDLATGIEEWRASENWRFSDDGRALVAASFQNRGLRVPLDTLKQEAIGDQQGLGTPVEARSRDGRWQARIDQQPDGRQRVRITGPAGPTTGCLLPQGVVFDAWFSPDSQRLIVSALDVPWTIFDCASGRVLVQTRMRGGAVSRSGRYLLGGSTLTQIVTGKRLPLPFNAADTHIAFSPDERQVFVADFQNRLWRVETATGRGTVLAKMGCYSLAPTPDGRGLAALSRNGEVRLLDAATGALRWRLPSLSPAPQVLWAGSQTMAFSPDGATLAVGADREVALVDRGNGRVLRRLGRPAFAARSRFTGPTTFVSTAGRRLVRWDLASARAESVAGLGGVVDVSADGRRALTFVGQEDRVVDIRSGRILWRRTDLQKRRHDTRGGLRSEPDKLDDPSYAEPQLSPDGRFVVHYTDGAFRIIAVDSGRQVAALAGVSGDRTWRQVSPCAFSPDSRLVAMALRGQLIAAELDTGRIVRRWSDDRYPDASGLAFSHDGRQVLASLSTAEWVTRPDGSIHLSEPPFTRVHDLDTGATQPTPWREVGGVRPSPDGRKLASWETFDSVSVIDPQQRRSLYTLHPYPDNGDSRLQSVSFSPDSRCVLTSGKENNVALWRADDGEEIARFVALDSGDWIVTTPEGYYTASRGAARAIGFRVEGQNYPFEQFDLKLNRPDIVLERLGYADLKTIAAYRKLYEKRLRQAGIGEDQLSPDFHTPLLRLDQKALPATTRVGTVTIAAHALDDRQKLSRIAVSVNGVPASGVDLAGRGLSEWSGPVSVELTPGRNRIQVWAVNEQQASSRKQTVEVFFDDRLFRPDLYVLTVGVDQTTDPTVQPLEFAQKDARDIAAYFTGRSARWRKVYSRSLLGAQADRAEIEKALATFFESARIGDTVLVYFAGHGQVLDDFYFYSHDARKAELAQTGLSFAAIDGALAKVRARQKLLLLDACQSGEVDREALGAFADAPRTVAAAPTGTLIARAADPVPVPLALEFGRAMEVLRELFANLERGSGVTVIGASGWAESALEDTASGQRNGLFAFALLSGLKGRGADLNKDREIRLSELQSWVSSVVYARSDRRQRPTTRQENPDNDFVVD